MKKYAKLIVKEGFFGRTIRTDLIADSIILGGLDYKELQIDTGFFRNTYTFIVYGETSTIFKVWNTLKVVGMLDIRLEEYGEMN